MRDGKRGMVALVLFAGWCLMEAVAGTCLPMTLVRSVLPYVQAFNLMLIVVLTCWAMDGTRD